jgi:hypothetical protein
MDFALANAVTPERRPRPPVKVKDGFTAWLQQSPVPDDLHRPDFSEAGPPMSSHVPFKSCLLAIALASMSAGVLAAPPGGGHAPPPPPTARQRHDDALSDSVRRIERSTRGQVLSAERVPFDGRDVNRIKTVDDRGRVRVFMDDPHAAQPRQPDPPLDSD